MADRSLFGAALVVCVLLTARPVALILPATLLEGGASLGIFAVFYGLDWIATVPPTVKLTTEVFGRENTGVLCLIAGASFVLIGRRALARQAPPREDRLSVASA